MNTLTPEQIRDALRGKPVQEVAALAGVCRQTVYRIRVGAKYNPSHDTLQRITNALLGIKTGAKGEGAA